MKRVLLTAFLACNAAAFGFSAISDAVKSGVSALGMDGDASTIEVDKECKNLFESYDVNVEGLFVTLATYGVSNSSKIVGFLNKGNSGSETLNQDDIKKLANNLSKNYLWIPLEVEELYAAQIYEDRLKSGDVVLRTSKNKKYKDMYKKLDTFLAQYNTYLKENNLSYPYDIKLHILSTSKKAESLPYGYIFISEDYIANGMYETILAHELSHVSKRHPTKEIQFRLVSTYENITDLTKMIKDMQSSSADKTALAALMTPEMIQKSFEMYAQEQELEADSCGLKTIHAFIPNKKEKHTKNFITNIESSAHYDKKEEDNFKNHPEKEARISNLKLIAESL
ncbi:MAG: M48 family metalloprotease [Arcobacteraceae bacterium]